MLRKKVCRLKAMSLGLGVILSIDAAAAGFVIETTVVGTLQSSDMFGGCMARLGTNLQAAGFDCTADPLVSFDCSGKIGSKSAGSTNFSGAQLAYVTGNKINIYVDDTVAKKNAMDGFCYSNRIDLLAPGS